MRTHIDHNDIAVTGNGGAPCPPRILRNVIGRGAVTSPAVRFDKRVASPFDDGWDTLMQEPGAQAFGAQEFEQLPRLDTSVIRDTTRSAISWNNSPDIGFDRAVNPYRGCEHGCIYCFARPTHAYLGYSPGLDFETKLFAKPNAAALLEEELSKRSYRCKPMAMGTNTDPFQPVERRYAITRSVLEVLARFNHPVTIVTKSALVMRDIDILAPMAAKGLARVALSITTLDLHLARAMEPRASTPGRRLLALKAL